MEKIVQSIKRNNINMNSVDLLSLVRKNMKLCDKITGKDQMRKVNFAGYQRMFETKFLFGIVEKSKN